MKQDLLKLKRTLDVKRLFIHLENNSEIGLYEEEEDNHGETFRVHIKNPSFNYNNFPYMELVEFGDTIVGRANGLEIVAIFKNFDRHLGDNMITVNSPDLRIEYYHLNLGSVRNLYQILDRKYVKKTIDNIYETLTGKPNEWK